MTDLTESEVIEVGDLDPEQWNDYAEKQGWSDGMPLMVPTEKKVAAFGSNLHGDNEPFCRCRRAVSFRQCKATPPMLRWRAAGRNTFPSS